MRVGMQCCRSAYLTLLNCLLIGGTMLMGFACEAQPYLAREITVNGADTQRMGDLLDGISTRWGFYFAYNSDVVDADKQVNQTHYRGTLVGFLEQVLGERKSTRLNSSH